eukprot:CAMPEP_0171953202 /NCGR_PEP_ID=MMETSP0993-20121228/93874_1 /TAXON_ID=483369 /ORGANISM="non described non described, Strain CCMP2098" /LENGTH=48 /DNA_ID= /DNA_START= /DNA_END= /DNA_ORIENTATION=
MTPEAARACLWQQQEAAHSLRAQQIEAMALPELCRALLLRHDHSSSSS